MNAVFTFIVIISMLITTLFSPTSMLTIFSQSAWATFELCVKLLSIYCIFMGFSEIIKESGLKDKLSKLLKPITTKLLKTNNSDAIEEISLSFSANLLGLGGIATPSIINAMGILDEEQNESAKTMLFVISATSIQIIPLTVMQLMTEYNSTSPSIIFLPTLISTTLSTLIGVILCKVFK